MVAEILSVLLVAPLAGPLVASGSTALTGRGAWTDSDVQGGSVDELLGVAVERPALEQLEVEVGRILEDRVQPGLAGDHGEERYLDPVDQAGAHQRPVH